MESTNPRSAIAVDHLRLLKEQHERLERDDRHYVQLGLKYGLSVEQVAIESGISPDRVRTLADA